MSDLMTLPDIIAALEKCTGPDRELDCAIIKALFGVNPYPVALGGDWKWYTDDLPISDVPHYTDSVDAALSLVPSGYLWEVSNWSLQEGRGPYASLSSHEYAESICEGHHATSQAIAFVIASLRARLAMEEKV